MRNLLSSLIDASDAEYELFISQSRLCHFKKNEHLLVAASPAREIFFIEYGLVRGYRIVDGDDVTHHFFQENWFATDYQSFLSGFPGELHLQALVDTTALVFNKGVLHSFFKKYPAFERVRSILAEHAFLQMVERIKDLQTLDLKERYNNLVSKNPTLQNQVAQKHIASYLGVAPQSLSRMKKESLSPKS